MKVQNPDARLWYLEEVAQQNWSVRKLERNINTFYYQRLLANKSEVKTVDSSNQQQTADFIKRSLYF